MNLVVEISGRSGTCTVRIESVEYVKCADMTLEDFRREGIVNEDVILDIGQYRTLFGRIWFTCYKSVLQMQDNVCLFRFDVLPELPV